MTKLKKQKKKLNDVFEMKLMSSRRKDPLGTTRRRACCLTQRRSSLA